jgi:hypothetical protein
MRCDYTVTYKDFLESLKGYRRASRRAALGYSLYVFVVPLLCIPVGAFFIWKFVQAGSSDYSTSFLAGVLLLGIGFGFPARYRVGMKRAFQQRDVLLKGGTMQCEFDQQTIRFVVPAGPEISYPWESFSHYFENDEVAVVIVKESAFHTIPKRSMDEAGWSEFRRIVQTRPGIKSC